MIQVQGLSFAYRAYRNNQPLFENISFTVHDGELLLVSGSSGSGKTTLLYCLCGVIPRTIKGSLSGEINIDGKAVADMSCAELPSAVAMVFQEPGSRFFLPAVEDELAFVPENLCIPREEMHKRIANALELTGLTEKQFENPAKLSGGQVKLTALTAILVFPPRVLLLDEITAGLDNSAVERVIHCVNRLRKQGCAVIISDHKPEIWSECGAQTLRMGGE